MEKHEVVIVGAGPGGLKAAKTLEDAGKKDILLLEAFPKERIGDKHCTGLVPPRAIETIGIPEDIICPVLDRIAFHIGGVSFIVPIQDWKLLESRRALGQYQLSLLDKTEVRDNTKITDVDTEKNYATTDDGEQIGYDYLIDGSGFRSPIRKKLLGKCENYWQCFSYRIKTKEIADDTGHFYVYSDLNSVSLSWSMPHKHYFEITVAYPNYCKINEKRAKQHMREIAESKGLSVEGSEQKAAPVPWDYRGFRFGNIFLIGDAAGLPSTVCGEGIYQAAKSGEIAAKAVIKKDYNWEKELNKAVLKRHEWGPGAWLPKIRGIANTAITLSSIIAQKSDINIEMPKPVSYLLQNVLYAW